MIGEIVIFVYQNIDFGKSVCTGIAQNFFEHFRSISVGVELEITEEIAIVCHHDFDRAAIQIIEVLFQSLYTV